jgi:hypothetical protein
VLFWAFMGCLLAFMCCSGRSWAASWRSWAVLGVHGLPLGVRGLFWDFMGCIVAFMGCSGVNFIFIFIIVHVSHFSQRSTIPKRD